MTTEVIQYQQPAALERQQQSNLAVQDFESVLRFALEKGASLSEIVAVRKQLKDEQAAERFNAALASFQAECPVIVKTKAVAEKGGSGVRYRYAPLDEIVTQVKPLLLKHGFSYSLTTDIHGSNVKAIMKLTHAAGHSQISEFQVPIDPKAYMNDQQKFGSALTFAKRYAFTNALGILTADEDTDARGRADRRPAGPNVTEPDKPLPRLKALLKELWDLLQPVRGKERNWIEANQWLWRNEILDGAVPEEAPNLTEQRVEEVIKKVKATLQ